MHRYTVWILWAMLLTPHLPAAQPVTHHPRPEEALASRWTWAEEQAGRPSGGHWIGYSIERLMNARSFIGSWSSHERRMSLMELIYNRKPAFDGFRGTAEDGPDREVVKEIAFLFFFPPNASTPTEVEVGDLSSQADLRGKPLYWLGGAGDEESLAHVQRLFDRVTSENVREELVVVFAMHDDRPAVVDQLRRILAGTYGDGVREQAAFWLGQQDDATALELLLRTARTDQSVKVREQAVFAISQTDLPEAVDALIDLVRSKDAPVRKQAIFWLGQHASKRASDVLGTLVDEGPDTEVQKQVVFAISQLDNDDAIPLLIKIARTHRNVEVRKQAIFWLGQSEDPRAVDALIELTSNS